MADKVSASAAAPTKLAGKFLFTPPSPDSAPSNPPPDIPPYYSFSL